MGEKEMVDLLRLYRHDLMNDLQIVQGYASMGKLDKVKTKIAECMDRFYEERKLMSLGAPKFALWLIQVNSIHANIRLTYYINMENIHLQAIDDTLVKYCQSAIDLLGELLDNMELYNGELHLEATPSTIDARFLLAGNFPKEPVSKLNKKHPNKMSCSKTDNGVSCIVSIPFSRMR
ncbi:hypothetical protein F3157_00730 [Virgibacillus dakarensis]|uniref:SpoOB alpha-helical domain-containing protein n=1 Tax=Lentibacillus populi TaxID=1827502 RepID=A0A9W5X412_9BACI|nr:MULTISPECIES: Spo0B domain-containing protein [Bacillaceae]MBT2215143.1 Spo0B domain-containing protein [Virgibacillus dakarensis]MTW84195.1 hypothetical protein [Virgibacillus dakarensis]GGB28297.1 hypothetical protein GCM10011409_02070 [Lentibacillus populi]